MTFDVPLPPCVEHQRRRRPMDARAIELAIWRHAIFTTELAACPTCQFIAPWDADPGVLDPGVYVDEAGHRLVMLGHWPREAILTARQSAQETSRAFMKRKTL